MAFALADLGRELRRTTEKRRPVNNCDAVTSILRRDARCSHCLALSAMTEQFWNASGTLADKNEIKPKARLSRHFSPVVSGQFPERYQRRFADCLDQSDVEQNSRAISEQIQTVFIFLFRVISQRFSQFNKKFKKNQNQKRRIQIAFVS